jgi:hypothetical protein
VKRIEVTSFVRADPIRRFALVAAGRREFATWRNPVTPPDWPAQEPLRPRR